MNFLSKRRNFSLSKAFGALKNENNWVMTQNGATYSSVAPLMSSEEGFTDGRTG
jgi:hypothetical protein